MVSHSFSSCWHLQVVESQQQRGIRRRCLVFEAAGFGFSNSAVKKGTIEDRSVSTCSKGKSPAQSQPRGLRGIGLHLNALALTPKGKMACQDPPPTAASALLPSSASEKDARGELLCAGENFAHSGGELLEFPFDDCSAGGGFPVNDHHVSGQSVSPQKKRFVSTSVSAWNGRDTATISLHFNSLKTIWFKIQMQTENR
jgi:hypothetical protein